MVSPGAAVQEGQPVMELETDKAVIEVPSSVSGVVQEIRVKEGDKLKVGQVIFTVENGTGAKARGEAPAQKAEAPLRKEEAQPSTPATEEFSGGAAGVPAHPDGRDARPSTADDSSQQHPTPTA